MRTTSLLVLAGLLQTSAVCVATESILQAVDITKPRVPDVVYVPTPQPVVDAMLKLADVRPGEVVYDLGCGDGRAVITAARDFGARGIGVDIDPARIAECRVKASAAGVTDRVAFTQADLFQMNFSDADVLFLYLLTSLNERLRPRILDELRPGTRVVSNTFSMGTWEPDTTTQVAGLTVHFWVVPAKVAGEWKVSLPNGRQGVLSLTQQFQKVSGSLTSGEKTLPVHNGRLKGRTLTFSVGEGPEILRATAEVSGRQLSGTLLSGASPTEETWSGELAHSDI